MNFSEKQNANPTVYTVAKTHRRDVGKHVGSSEREHIDALEVFELIRHLNDPEHPLSLEQLNVVQLDLIEVDDATGRVHVQFTPTIPHCSMATLIGLCIRVKLRRSLPRRFKARVVITPGTHTSEAAINKQLNDKERVAAAMENDHLLEVVNRCVADTDPLEEDGESKMIELEREDGGSNDEDVAGGLCLDL